MKTKTTVIAIALLVGSTAAAQVTIQVQLPTISFPTPPSLVVVAPGVQVVSNYDEEVFLAGGWYYVRRNGQWFRTRTHTGGWVAVDAVLVPPVIVAFRPGTYRRYTGTHTATAVAPPQPAPPPPAPAPPPPAPAPHAVLAVAPPQPATVRPVAAPVPLARPEPVAAHVEPRPVAPPPPAPAPAPPPPAPPVPVRPAPAPVAVAPPPPAPAPAPVAVAPPPPAPAAGQVIHAKEIKASRIYARLIVCKEMDARDARIGRQVKVHGEGKGWGSNELRVPELRADTIYAKEIDADFIQADEVDCKDVEIGGRGGGKDKHDKGKHKGHDKD